MHILILFTAFSVTVFVFELLDSRQRQSNRSGRLTGVANSAAPVPVRRTTWFALLLVLLPKHFNAGTVRNGHDVVDLLRRSGYPYQTTGDFFTAAMHTLSIYLLTGGILAGLLVAEDVGLLPALLVGSLFVILGLRRPYSNLMRRIRKRAAALRANMLTGLAVLIAQLSAGVSVQEGLRRSAGIGGPFCNLLGLLVAQMEVAPFLKAIETVVAHLPDPNDIEAGLFVRAVQDYYNRNHPLLPSVQGLQTAVHREVLESTEARAALVRQRSGLFGVMAVVGLMITIIAPFVGVFTDF